MFDWKLLVLQLYLITASLFDQLSKVVISSIFGDVLPQFLYLLFYITHLAKTVPTVYF